MTSVIKLKQSSKKITPAKAITNEPKMNVTKQAKSKNDLQMVSNNTVLKMFKKQKDGK
jgi:hypothetical protein